MMIRRFLSLFVRPQIQVRNSVSCDQCCHEIAREIYGGDEERDDTFIDQSMTGIFLSISKSWCFFVLVCTYNVRSIVWWFNKCIRSTDMIIINFIRKRIEIWLKKEFENIVEERKLDRVPQEILNDVWYRLIVVRIDVFVFLIERFWLDYDWDLWFVVDRVLFSNSKRIIGSFLIPEKSISTSNCRRIFSYWSLAFRISNTGCIEFVLNILFDLSVLDDGIRDVPRPFGKSVGIDFWLDAVELTLDWPEELIEHRNQLNKDEIYIFF